MKSASKEQISLVVDAVAEAHKMLKKLGYPIRPAGEEEAYVGNRKKKQRMLYLMVKTPAGKSNVIVLIDGMRIEVKDLQI